MEPAKVLIPPVAAENTTNRDIVQRRMQILEMAESMGSITEACRKLGISRSNYYKLKRAFDESGVQGLTPRPRTSPKMPNAFPDGTVALIFEVTKKFPIESYLSIADRVRSLGVKVSGSGVRKVWRRAGLTDKSSRLQWLEVQSSSKKETYSHPQLELVSGFNFGKS